VQYQRLKKPLSGVFLLVERNNEKMVCCYISINYFMGFENFNSSEMPAAEQAAESLEVNKENIIEGHGFDEISRVGWEKYREALAETPYASIIEKYLAEKEKQPIDAPQGPPQWMQHNMNVEARTRATKLANFLTENYGKQKEGSTFVAYGGEQNDNKLMVPKDTAAAKENNLSNFMIPLDDTAAFVEAENLGSYHAGPWGRMYADLTGEMPHRGVGLKQLAEKLKQWTPQRPGLFSDDKARRRHMPGLIFG
jgi:hypothetical protein